MIAAVQNGADAVYLGGTKFSARAYASNFDDEELEKAVDYCHGYGVKVYITINTLIKDSEMDEALSYADFLYRIGVDALIVQDLGLISNLKRNLPDFELHASTQLSVHNGEGALWFTEKGIKRIVLARELSLEEIRHISIDLGVETEIFIHGALCISYSGQCLMSSILGGRSGNRGRCAQPCRLPYDLLDSKGNKAASAYLMSPKDISAIDMIKDIRSTGTSSLKIEGRMKKPEYVAETVRAFREELDGMSDPKHREELLQVFNREGFSDGWFKGRHGKDMMAMTNPKNAGLEIGTVLPDGTIKLNKPLSKGDGVRVGDEGQIVSRMYSGRETVESASKGDTIKLDSTRRLPAGTLYKTLDKGLMEELSKTYENSYGRKLPISARLIFTPGREAEITAEFDGRVFKSRSRVVEKAMKAPLSLERITESMKKTEGPYFIAELTPDVFQDGFLPVSELNAMRRDLLEQILSHKVSSVKRIIPERKISVRKSAEPAPALPSKLVVAATIEQVKAAFESGALDIAVYPWYRGKQYVDLKSLEALAKEKPDVRFYLRASSILKGEFDMVLANARKLYETGIIKGVLTSNMGLIRALRGICPVMGDYKLNLFNSSSLDLLGDDITGGAVSEELNRSELKEMKGKERLMYVIYGRQELMHSEYCPVGAAVGGMTREKPCNQACMRESYSLKDRMGEEFKVMTDWFCRSFIMNSKPKNLLDSSNDLKSIGFSSFRLDLTTESHEESVGLVTAFLSEKPFSTADFNRGHYKRGVE